MKWLAVSVTVVLLLVGRPTYSAPLPPFDPVDICGEVVSLTWSEAIEVPGKPGFSGSLGHDHAFPARFRVELARYTGIDAGTAALINGMLDFVNPAGDRLLVLIDSPDRHLLDTAGSLCVTGYTIQGDEGGTWTHYDRLTLR